MTGFWFFFYSDKIDLAERVNANENRTRGSSSRVGLIVVRKRIGTSHGISARVYPDFAENRISLIRLRVSYLPNNGAGNTITMSMAFFFFIIRFAFQTLAAA